jgi:putative SbcD/Mre11-related phosphoesterase
MPKVKLLVDYPAAFIEEKKALVITDLHLGIEHELFRSGITINPQAEKFAKLLNKLIEQLRAKYLIILGDVKHEVPGTSFRELKQIPKFFDALEDVKIFISKGNHDADLEDILPSNVSLRGSRGFRMQEYGFFHGHAWPSKALIHCDYLFMGHLQPAVEFVDSFGFRSIEQVWLKGRLNREKVKERYKTKKVGKLNLLILPSFNKLSGSLILNRVLSSELLGPIVSKGFAELEKFDVHLLDGTYLGKLGSIKIQA